MTLGCVCWANVVAEEAGATPVGPPAAATAAAATAAAAACWNLFTKVYMWNKHTHVMVKKRKQKIRYLYRNPSNDIQS